jgi:uncharacterized damage-inducible protein DinB
MNPLYRLWEYNNWANRLIIESFLKSPEKIPASCMRLLSHIVNVQSIWLHRIRGEKQTLGAWDEHELDACKSWHEQTSAGLSGILQEHASDLFLKIDYRNMQGQVLQDSIADLLLHIFNHGTYHRGQIAKEMRMNGLKPIATDFVIFSK